MNLKHILAVLCFLPLVGIAQDIDDITDSTDFSINNYLADIELVSSFVSYTEVKIVNDTVLKSDIERWRQFDDKIDTIIKEIEDKYRHAYRYRQISDLKKEISYWEIQTNKVVSESQGYEALLKSSLSECASYDTLLKKYIDSKSIAYDDLRKLNNARNKVKNLIKKLNKQNQSVARSSASLIRENRRLEILMLNIDQGFKNIFSFLDARKIETNYNYMSKTDWNYASIEILLDYLDKNPFAILDWTLIFLGFFFLGYLAKRNAHRTKLYYMSVGEYESTSLFLKRPILASTIMFSAMLTIIIFYSSYFVIGAFQGILYISFILITLQSKKYGRYKAIALIGLLITLNRILSYIYASFYFENDVAIIFQFVLIFSVIAVIIVQNTLVRKIVSLAVFVILTVMHMIFLYSINRSLAVNLLDLYNSFVNILVTGFVVQHTATKFIPAVFLTPKFTRASFVRRNYKRYYFRIKRFVQLFFFVVYAYVAAGALGMDNDLMNKLGSIWDFSFAVNESVFRISSLFSFFLTLNLSVSFLKLLKNIYQEFIVSHKENKENSVLIDIMMNVGIYFTAVILAFYFAGVSLTSMTIIISGLTVGIGFGLQNLVSNFISGIILAVEKPIRTQDIIELAGGLEGKVEKIGVRSSIVRTWDGAEVLVPNQNLISENLTNWTLTSNSRRIKVVVGVAYDSNLEEVLAVLQNAVNQCESIVSNPEPVTLCTGFLDSSIEFTSVFWSTASPMSMRSQLYLLIAKHFAEANIKIPFPQRDLRIIEMDKTPSREPRKKPKSGEGEK